MTEEKTTREEFKVAGHEILAKVKELIKEGICLTLSALACLSRITDFIISTGISKSKPKESK